MSKRRTLIGAGLGFSSIAFLALLMLTAGSIVDMWLEGTAVPATRWLVALGATVAAAVSGGLAPWYTRRAARLEESRLRAETISHVHRRGPAWAASARSGSVVGLAMDEAPRVTEYRQAFLSSMLAALAGPVLVLVLIAVAIDWLSALILALLTPLIPLAIKGSQRLFKKASAESRRARGRLTASYLDAIQGLTTYRLLNAAPRAAAEMAAQGEANRRSTMRLLAGNQVVILAMDGIFSLTMITGSIVLAGWRLSSGAITAGQALAMVLLAFLLLEPLDKVGSFFYLSMGGKAAEAALSRHFATGMAHVKPPASGSPDAVATHTTGYPERGAAKRGIALTATDLTFAWPGRQPVVSGLNLTVSAGERLGITGPSGCGKSTLLNLLTGALEPDGGAIAIDGRALSSPERRERFGVVTQSTWLFTGTVADNLRIGNPDATDDDLWQALDQVTLAADVRAMPDGLATDIGEGGGRLSGGQAQRLSLARALVSGRTLIVLDEPTAHIDLASERHLMAALEALGREYTIIIVTHRASLAGMCDRVLTLTVGTVTPHD